MFSNLLKLGIRESRENLSSIINFQKPNECLYQIATIKGESIHYYKLQKFHTFLDIYCSIFFTSWRIFLNTNTMSYEYRYKFSSRHKYVVWNMKNNTRMYKQYINFFAIYILMSSSIVRNNLVLLIVRQYQ